MVKLVDIGTQKTRLHYEFEISKGLFWSLFQEHFAVAFTKMGTQQVLEVLQSAIGMALCCQKDDGVHHMLCWALVGKDVC